MKKNEIKLEKEKKGNIFVNLRKVFVWKYWNKKIKEMFDSFYMTSLPFYQKN